MKYVITLLLFVTSLQAHYPLTREPIDVVIPCHKKDLETLDLCIEGIRENGENIRRIIVISSERLTDQAEWFSEEHFPFSKMAIAERFFGNEQLAEIYLSLKTQKAGWVFQQLLKLYAPLTIPDISSNVLVLDADTIFLQRVSFLTEEGAGLYHPSCIDCPPYLKHMNKLVPDLTQVFPGKSGVCHHMIFQRPIMEDLFKHIEDAHQKEMWEAFCDCMNLMKFKKFSVPSEYEIYFNFAFSHTDQVKLRVLKWRDSSKLDLLSDFKENGYDFVSFHTYLR